jgi:Response regulator of the LytR/AlgR family
MKLALVDDDKTTTDLLNDYIKRFEKENEMMIKVAVFHNPNDFLTNYSRDYDLILLDIQMPGLSGIETAKELRRMDSRVVLMFITNMAQYAINGYEVEAVDYVLKPVAYPDFSLKIQKAIRYVARNQDEKLMLNTQEGTVHLYVSDICYIEVIRHYLVYHTLNGSYMVRGIMKEVEEALSKYHFSRSNHCYLINLEFIEAISGDIVKVGGDDLKISRNKKNKLLMEFTRYVGGIQ